MLLGRCGTPRMFYEIPHSCTIGSYICLYIIELIENQHKEKACKYYYAALYYHSKKFEEKTYSNLRKCLYFGGDNYEIIILNTLELKPYLEKLGYFKKIENSVSKENRFKKLLDLIKSIAQ